MTAFGKNTSNTPNNSIRFKCYHPSIADEGTETPRV